LVSLLISSSLNPNCSVESLSFSAIFFPGAFFVFLGSTTKETALMFLSRGCNIFKISFPYFCSSHSLEKELGVATEIIPSSKDKILVLANQVAKLAGEMSSCI